MGAASNRIDRREVVGRHSIASCRAELPVPLGNGEFCFNADGTGFQTLAGSAMDHRGWFALPVPTGVDPADIPPTGTYMHGRIQDKDVFPEGREALFEWMTDSPQPGKPCPAAPGPGGRFRTRCGRYCDRIQKPGSVDGNPAGGIHRRRRTFSG